MKNFIRKFINGEENSIVVKNHNNNNEINQEYIPHYNQLKEFLTHGIITEKSYNSPQIVDNSITLPAELSTYFINKIKDISILKFLKIIHTDSNNIIIPIRNGNGNCLWHEYGKSPVHNNEDKLENKLINIGTVSTCPSVSRDFLFKNENFVQWLMDTIVNDIYNEVCLSIFNHTKEVRSIYVDSLFQSINGKRIKIIDLEDKKFHIIQNLKDAINNVDGIYRNNSQFFISRKFFHSLLKELLDFNHHLCNFVLGNNTIFGYQYTIVEQIEDNIAIFGDLSSAYTLIIKNDQYLERDSVTKKHFIQFFFAHSFGGSVVNDDSLFIIKIKEEE